VRRCVCALLMFGGLAHAQASPPPSFAAKEAADAAVSPTAKSSAGSASDLPPLPPGRATLLGGTIRMVDHLRDRLALQAFGGGRIMVTFDERTRIYRDGSAAASDDLKNGDRVYADTVLDGTQVFARRICVTTGGPIGQSNGQIVNFDPAKGELTMRDTISTVPWKMRLASDAVILREDRPATPAELRPGTLVTVAFLPAKDGQVVVRQISILASPGGTFVFAGRVEYLDLRRGLLVLMDPRGNKSYDLCFDSADRALTLDIREGADVTVSARFDGKLYTAHSITVNKPSSQ